MIRQEKDWFMRQIQMLAQFVARAVFGRDVSFESFEMIAEEAQAGDIGALYTHLKELLAAGDICTAENTLHDGFEDSKAYVHLAMWFYHELSAMTDEALAAADFSREEIYVGLRDVLHQSGVPLSFLTEAM